MRPPAEPERPFAEPWHAELFATTHALAAAGLFAWPDWAARFSEALAQADVEGGPADGSNYYDVWLTAFEAFLVERGLAETNGIDALRDAWERAYLETPHGAPVSLAGDSR